MRRTLEKGLNKKDQMPPAAEEEKPKTPQTMENAKQTNSNGCLVLHFGSIREVNHPIKALSKILDMAWNNNYILIVVGTEYFWPIDPSKNSNLNDLTISNALTSILGEKNGPSIIITAVEPDHAETVCAKFKPQITLQAAQIGQSQKVTATA